MSVANSSMGKDMGGIDFAAHKGKNIANSTLIRTVIRGLLKNGHKKTPQENSYGVWDRKKALILSYQRLFFRRYLILNLTPRSLPPKNIVLPTNSMFSYPEAGNGCPFCFVIRVHFRYPSSKHVPARFVTFFFPLERKIKVRLRQAVAGNCPPDSCI